MSDPERESKAPGFFWLAIGLGAGLFVGLWMGESGIQDQAITNGHGQYNAVTGEFEWKGTIGGGQTP